MLSKYTNSLKRTVSKNPGITLLLIALLIGAIVYMFVKPGSLGAVNSGSAPLKPVTPPVSKTNAKTEGSSKTSSTEEEEDVELSKDIVEAFRNRRRRTRWF